ncbi:hypothetical protein AGABI2DRAFT_134649 [Agaricus bisporus var. bisporus H97]|uniref:hypothetical protein n=1 Tax=Agaricus bisporus var. bisporus (strain H97 / ATCC MYA-4626 / FGSC 10389) TaxID=936046 RepID=UPI00029F75E0|nr:hypothetical protein AGABI2DRAFT_134649 [Agaricus bisporus var. bisporus H97]EKV49043.1 hypothetical protein AGABI2DRAFT_134649 [Agaricus bisporus var. bisporus H97]
MRSVLGPLGYTTLLAESCQESSALGFITELGVADLLGENAMTVNEMSNALGVKEKYLKVALSCITKHGYFDEVDTGSGSLAYRNNVFSNVLKADHPTSLRDAIGFMCDDGFKASSQLLPASKVTGSNGSDGKEVPAINLAFGFKDSVFDWLSRESWRGRRMGNAMQQLHRVANENTAFDYDWSALESPIIDVGGGIGSLEMIILRNLPQERFQFVVFDKPGTVEQGKKVWQGLSVPETFSVSFQAGDFMATTFEETSIPAGKSTYIIRHVLHNWSDQEVLRILGHVRTAMSLYVVENPSIQPKLILCETIVSLNSNRFVRASSMQIMAMSNGWLRTDADLIRLLEEAGFSFLRFHRMRADDSIIEATLKSG